jgi:hypothetical protein
MRGKFNIFDMKQMLMDVLILESHISDKILMILSINGSATINNLDIDINTIKLLHIFKY